MNNITIIPIKNLPEFSPKHDLADELIRGFENNNIILENNDVRTTLPKVSDWPTFPQVFINGELIGGADIIAQMHESGELKKLIDSINT